MGERLHHVGMSVSDLDAALAFWERFLGLSPRWRTVLDRPYLGRNVGYPGVVIDAAFLDLPDGTVIELLAYREVAGAPLPEASASPGHLHICLGVEDVEASCARACAAGAEPVCPDGPQAVDAGPNAGAKAVYLRVPPDRWSLELFQAPR